MQPSITGRYPAKGAYKILKAGIPILDETGPEVFENLREGNLIEIRANKVYAGKRCIAEGRELCLDDVQLKLRQANENAQRELDRFVENTLEYALKEKDILLGNLEVPILDTHILNRHVLIVVRGSSYKEDLKAIKWYIEDENPVLIGVDGGADALMEFGLKPDIIVGDMDSVSDDALRSGAEIVVHAYADGKAPGLQRVEEMGLEARIIPMPGTSEDAAMILAWEYGASLIVAVGSHSNMIDFLEKGRKGMGSTFLVRLKVGSILVDARGVSQLYKHSLQTRYLAQLFVAALVPISIILWVSPATKPFFRLLSLQLKLLFSL
ncbi:putative cytokinetic ring protein SteA [Syntrophomonas palmitatica]|uniref:putative cytokinetic ring protein SteA n=1 Tax=Syntrophomonas palmitatica TaxID=402877 RepID=UPI000A5DD0C8